MASANITALTNLATMQPSMLMYAGLSPFGVTDDRKITASALLTTISALNNNIAAVKMVSGATPTVPTFVCGDPTSVTIFEIDTTISGSGITTTLERLSYVRPGTSGLGIWANANAGGFESRVILYSGTAQTLFTELLTVGGGAGNSNFLDQSSSSVLTASSQASGGMAIVSQHATAPLVFAQGGAALSNEKGRFDAAGLTLGHVSTITGALNLANSASAFLTTIQAGNAAAARTYVWPTNFGSAGDVLTDAAGNGVLSWAAGGGGASSSGCTVTNSSGQSIADSANVALTFDTEVVDTDAYHSGSGSAMTVPTTGFYSVSASADFGANSTGARFIWFFINGSGIRYGWNSGAAPLVLSAAATVFMSAGDSIECIVAQTSGSPLSLSTGGSLTNYQIGRLP